MQANETAYLTVLIYPNGVIDLILISPLRLPNIGQTVMEWRNPFYVQQFFFLFHALCMMSPQQLHLNGVSIVVTNLICIHVCMLNKKIRFLQKDKILYMYLFIGTCFKIDSVFI